MNARGNGQPIAAASAGGASRLGRHALAPAWLRSTLRHYRDFMRTVITIGVLTVFIPLAGCIKKAASQTSRSPRDAEIRQKVVGVWKSDSTHLLTVNSDGSIVSASKGDGRPESLLTFRGRWRVTNGWLLMTVADEDGKISDLADVQSNRVVRIDDHEWVLQEGEEDTNSTIFHKQ